MEPRNEAQEMDPDRRLEKTWGGGERTLTAGLGHHACLEQVNNC